MGPLRVLLGLTQPIAPWRIPPAFYEMIELGFLEWAWYIWIWVLENILETDCLQTVSADLVSLMALTSDPCPSPRQPGTWQAFNKCEMTRLENNLWGWEVGEKSVQEWQWALAPGAFLEASKLRKYGIPSRPKPTYWLIIPNAGGSIMWWLKEEPLSAFEPILILASSVSLGRLYLWLSFFISKMVTATIVSSL